MSVVTTTIEILTRVTISEDDQSSQKINSAESPKDIKQLIIKQADLKQDIKQDDSKQDELDHNVKQNDFEQNNIISDYVAKVFPCRCKHNINIVTSREMTKMHCDEFFKLLVYKQLGQYIPWCLHHSKGARTYGYQFELQRDGTLLVSRIYKNRC
jgi:hypothetical protein